MQTKRWQEEIAPKSLFILILMIWALVALSIQCGVDPLTFHSMDSLSECLGKFIFSMGSRQTLIFFVFVSSLFAATSCLLQLVVFIQDAILGDNELSSVVLRDEKSLKQYKEQICIKTVEVAMVICVSSSGSHL